MASPLDKLSLGKLGLPAKILAGVILCGLVFGVHYVFIYTDIAAKIDTAKRKSADLDRDLTAQKQAQASYFADRDELAMRQQRQRELNKVLPEEAEAAAFLSAIQQVSNTSGINLKAWSPQEEQASQFYAKVPMRLEITGKYHQLTKFVYEVGKLDRIINMENIQISNPHLEGDEIVVNAKMLATTFHVLKKPAAPAAGGKK
jgi:type IV pilus assembly protein PilO